jgi:hypothetical protein
MLQEDIVAPSEISLIIYDIIRQDDEMVTPRIPHTIPSIRHI